MKTFVISIVFFIAINYLAKSVILKYWQPIFYEKHRGDDKKQQATVAMIISIVHHIFTTITAVYCLFIMPPQDLAMRMIYRPIKQNLDYYPITS